MSFVPSGETVEVQATLTAKGRKKLFDSLEDVNEPFVTRFALGDSDANYEAIESGFGTLTPGFVPSIGEFVPRIRSYVLRSGVYKPTPPVILVNGSYSDDNGHYFEFPIGNNEPRTQTFTIETEWPKATKYQESYSISTSLDNFQRPSSISSIGFISEFTRAFNSSFENNVWTIEFTGDLDPSIRETVLGTGTNAKGGLTWVARVEGNESQLVTSIAVDFVL